VSDPTSAQPPHLSVAGDTADWHRLHPLTPVVRAGRGIIAFVVAVALIAIANQRNNSQLVVDLVVLALALSGGFISWLVTRWQVANGVLRIDTGLIRRDSRRFPLTQIQAIDVVQTGLARVLGLAELQLRVAGSDSKRSGRLACLRLADAEELRRELLALSAAAGTLQAEHPPGLAAPLQGSAETGVTSSVLPVPGARVSPEVIERPLFRVRSGRLAVAIVLSRSGAIAAVVIAAVVTTIAVTGSTTATASFLPFAFGIVLAVWRQFSGEYGTRVAAAPDGFRLRSGLIQITTETVRPGRVQGIRLEEPLVWRAFGWCRLAVDVAGPKERGENRSEGRRLRALVPVGSRAEALQMVDDLLASRPMPDRRAPREARLKGPFQYHFLAWGSDERYVVTSRGRVCRKTTWVPLEKVQSIRWVQGPVQRRLGLATVNLDVAGRRVTASIDDRTQAEAGELFGRLPDLARAARAG